MDQVELKPLLFETRPQVLGDHASTDVNKATDLQIDQWVCGGINV